MLDLLTSLLNRYDVSDFAAVSPVLVTYICSGLTSLNMVILKYPKLLAVADASYPQAIRKDTLVVLHCICTLQPILLMNYAEKVCSNKFLKIYSYSMTLIL